jgi:hypothetical protein
MFDGAGAECRFGDNQVDETEEIGSFGPKWDVCGVDVKDDENARPKTRGD